MYRKRIFEAVLLSLTIAYAVVKAIEQFQDGDTEMLEEYPYDHYSDTS